MPKLPQEIQKIKSRRTHEIGDRFRQGGPRVGLLYPSPYRAAMSSLGYQWMLAILQDAGFSAERIILPDNLKAWTQSRSPLLSYESLTPLSHFPIIAVSLAYELELAGLIQALEASGIPALRAHRGPKDPLILLGGPLTFSNPLPAAPFVDAILLGEAEETIIPAVTAAFDTHRSDWLKTITSLSGGYVPEIHGEKLPAMQKPPMYSCRHALTLFHLTQSFETCSSLRGNEAVIEACSFCVMRRSTNGGMRLVTPETIVSYIPEHAKKVGLVGAAISDHPKLVGLLENIVKSGREVGVSSLRADQIARKPDVCQTSSRRGYQTLTVASDAASQRLRRTISKGTLEKHLMSCAEQAAQHQYRTLKVYMMLGLPDENEEDIEELIRFTLELAQIHSVALGIAPFVAKKNTPMDGLPFAGIKRLTDDLKQLERGLKKSKGRASIRPTSAKWAWVEYMLAQGGSHAGLAVYDAVRAGGSFANYKRLLSV